MLKCGNSLKFRKHVSCKDILQYLGIAVYLIKTYVQKSEDTITQFFYHWKKGDTEHRHVEVNGFQLVINKMTNRQNWTVEMNCTSSLK